MIFRPPHVAIHPFFTHMWYIIKLKIMEFFQLLFYSLISLSTFYFLSLHFLLWPPNRPHPRWCRLKSSSLSLSLSLSIYIYIYIYIYILSLCLILLPSPTHVHVLHSPRLPEIIPDLPVLSFNHYRSPASHVRLWNLHHISHRSSQLSVVPHIRRVLQISSFLTSNVVL